MALPTEQETDSIRAQLREEFGNVTDPFSVDGKRLAARAFFLVFELQISRIPEGNLRSKVQAILNRTRTNQKDLWTALLGSNFKEDIISISIEPKFEGTFLFYRLLAHPIMFRQLPRIRIQINKSVRFVPKHEIYR